MIGVTIRKTIGVGDTVQFSSLPENYFKATGNRLLDVSKSWIYDFNPFVLRDESIVPEKVVELWNFPQVDPWPNPRKYASDPAVYLSNAEVTAARFGIVPKLNRPRLYRFETFPFHERKKILFHPVGRCQGQVPDHVVEHIIKKYKPTGELYQIGLPTDPDFGLPRIETKDLWSLAEVLSEARMLIGPDSGPSWIASCYPDVIVKKIRMRYVHGQKEMPDWIPLEIANIHAHWDDRCAQFYNITEDDLGHVSSYRRL
jgi:hypothetical protein